MLGDYKNNIPRWDTYFSKDSLLYLPFGRVKSDPDNLLREVEAFLGVEPRREFQRSTDAIHKGLSIEIPREIDQRLAELAKPQKAFLEARFGSGFASQI
jgi:hypothetical protein